MAVEENMVILADEVYQANIWKKDASFSSFKKVIDYHNLLTVFVSCAWALLRLSGEVSHIRPCSTRETGLLS